MLSSNIIVGDGRGAEVAKPLAIEELSINSGIAGLDLEYLGPSKESPKAVADEHEEKEDAGALRKAAYEEGYRDGEAAGHERGAKEVEPVIRGLTAAAGELALLKEKLYKDYEKEVVRLAVAAAKKIVQSEIKSGKPVVAGAIKRALTHLSDGKAVTIRLNPDDKALLSRHKKELFKGSEEMITLIEDDTVERGGCIVESDFGGVDASIGKQFELLEESLG